MARRRVQDNDDFMGYSRGSGDADPLPDFDMDVDDSPPVRAPRRGRRQDVDFDSDDSQGMVDAGLNRRERRQQVMDANIQPAPGFSVRKERSRSTGQEVYRILLHGRPIPTSGNPEGRYALSMESAIAQTHVLNPQTGARRRPWDRG